MSTADLGEVPAQVLRQWPGRWRYPLLSAVLADEEEVSADQAARWMLRGLADPKTPEQVAGEYVAAGMFAIAEELLDQADLPAAAAEALRQRLKDARATAAAQIEDRIFALRHRAEQAGADFLAEDDRLRVLAITGSSDAIADLAVQERSIENAERTCAAELTQRAEELLAAFDGDGLTWRNAVAACVDSREFAAARELLAAGPAVLPAGRPLSVPRPLLVWPFHGSSLREVLTWYDPGQPAAAAAFDRWRPADGDAPAARLVDAIRALVSDLDAGRRHHGIRPHHALDFALALQRLLGDDSPECSIKKAGQGVLASLRIPAPDAVPGAPLTGLPAVPLWVADAGDPPPDDLHPLVWFVPAVHVAEFTPWGVARLDAADLLQLLPPCPATDVTQHRRVNLLRAVASRLPADDFLGRLRMDHSPAETEVSWLLDLAGIRPEPGCVQAILREIAGQPALLRGLLLRLAEDARPGEPRRQRLGLAAIGRVRRSDEWREEALNVLLFPLRRDRPAHVLLRVVAALYPDRGAKVTAADLEQYLEQAITPETVRSAASRLVSDLLLENTGPDEFQLPDTRVRELLTQAEPDKALADAAAAIAELKAADHSADPAVADSVIRFVGHQVDGYLAGIQTELSGLTRASAEDREGRAGRASKYARDASGVYRKYRDALSGDVACNLHDLLSDCASITEWLTAGAIRVSEVSGPADILVLGNEWLLGESFKVILDNARQEIQASGKRFGEISIRLGLDPTGPPDRHDAVAGWALTVIEDSGPGLDAETRAALTGGARQGITPRGQGTGLEMARDWFARFGGSLEIAREAGESGGARVRVWLPAHGQLDS
jgi:hypothetical protein